MPKAVRFDHFGGPEALHLVDVPLRGPGAGEVELQVKAVGLNRAESMYYRGEYMERAELPSGIGYEAVGIVTAVGEGVDQAIIGKRFGTIPGYSMNAYPVAAERAIVPAFHLAAVPPALTDTEAAAVWMQYVTAYGPLVELFPVGKGDVVIITAASSSVGLAALQIAKDRGAVTVATTRSSLKREGLLALGADHVVVTQEEDLPSRVKEITNGKLAQLVLDSIGGESLAGLVEATAPEGNIFLYGFLSGQPAVYPNNAFFKGVSLTGYTLFQMFTPERFERMKDYIYERLADGRFRPKIARVFPFEEIVQAYAYLESNQQVGKVVVQVG